MRILKLCLTLMIVIGGLISVGPGSIARAQYVPMGFWKITATECVALAAGPQIDVAGAVKTVLEDGATTYIGGDFTSVNGTSRSNFAAINSTTGAVLPFTQKFDGSVNSLAKSGNTLYVGGSFLGTGDFVIGRGAVFNSEVADTGFPPINGQVLTAIPDGAGGWYVGGYFSKVGSSNRNGLAHINSSNAVTSFDAQLQVNTYANDLELSGGILYVGGSFSSLGGASRNHIGAVDATTGIATAWNPSSSSVVRDILLDGTTMYVAGSFSSIGGAARKYLAALDTTINTNNATSFDVGVDGAVYTLAKYGNILYAGGYFSLLGGVETSGIEMSAAGAMSAVIPKVNGIVYAVVADGAGGWYIGGSFTTVGGATRNRIAQIDLSGAVTSWNPNASNTVNSLLLSGGTLYAGGTFTTIGGQTRNRLAAISTSTGLASAWNPNSSGLVSALALSGTTLYAGGGFTTIGGVTRPYLAALDTTVNTNNATSWGAGPNAAVSALAISGTTLYAGGAFQNLGGINTQGTVVNTSSVQNTAFPAITGGAVEIAIPDGSGGWYIGGSFTTVGGLSRSRLARVDSTGAVTAWNPGASSTVYALVLDGTTLYAGGAFSTLGGASRSRIGAVSTTVNTGNATSWNPSASSTVYALVLNGTTMYAGGQFTTLGGASRSRIGAVSTTTDTNNATSWNPGASSTVYSMVLNGTTMYAGGGFSTLGGSSRSRIGAVSTTTDTSNATAWNPSASSTVYALVLDGTTLYVGGTFTTLGGSSRSRIGAVSTTTNTNNATTWNPGASSDVNSLSLSGTTMYVGGNFATLGGSARAFAGAVSTTTNTNNATAWLADQSATVKTITLSGSDVFIGGNFTGSGGAARNRLAALDMTANTNNVTAWNPDINDQIYALLLSGTTLYVGGDFSTVSGTSRYKLAALDTTLNTGMLTTWNPGLTSSNDVKALAKIGTTLYAGGDFSSAGGLPKENIAALDTTVNSNMGVASFLANSQGEVFALAASATHIYAGGQLGMMGGYRREAIGAIDVTSGSNLPTPWDAAIVGSSVNKVVLSSTGTVLYAGGYFSNIGGASRQNLAALNTAVNTNNATSWNPGANSGVLSMALSGTNLYVGGPFTVAGGSARNNLAGLNTGTGAATAWDPSPRGSVTALNVDGSKLFIGGTFGSFGGSQRNGLAALDTTQTTNNLKSFNPEMETSYDPMAWGPARVNKLILSGTTLYVGGNMLQIGNASRMGVVALDLTMGDSDQATSFDAALHEVETYTPAEVYDMILDGSTLYLAGTLYSSDYSRTHLMSVNSTTGAMTSWNPALGGTYWQGVHSIAKSGDNLYAGGDFTTDYGSVADYLAGFSISTGTALVWNPLPDAAVLSLAVVENGLYVAGDFTTIAGNARNGLALFNTDSKSLVSTWDPANGGALPITMTNFNGSKLYMGGNFTSIAGDSGRSGFSEMGQCGVLAAPPAGTDFTPNPVDWVGTSGYSNTSSSQTITGIDGNITLRFSLPLGLARYRLNGGSWVDFNAATPAEVSVAPNTTIDFYNNVLTTITITITNLSDSDTVLDTVMMIHVPD